jgi:signal peptidase II
LLASLAIALAVILWLVAFGVTPDLFLLGGYSLFFGGTLGNLIDRLRFGEVIDFLDVHVENLHWPAFNVADSALCVGAALFFIPHCPFKPNDSRKPGYLYLIAVGYFRLIALLGSHSRTDF